MALLKPKSAPPEPFGAEVARRIALAGATAQVDLGASSSWKTWKFGNKDWQTEGWRLYDIIPEHHFLAGRIGDSVAQARLYVTEVDDTGEETGEVQDERIKRLAAVPLGTGSQRDDNLRLAGLDLAVGGECWIVGEGAATSPEAAEGSWFVVTGSAISRTGDEIAVRRPQQRGGSKLVLVDGQDILIRCWRPHPNDTDQADSFTRSAIVPLREIELLTKREFAELDSRLTGAGIMFLPEGVDFPRGEEDPAGLAGFMAYLQRAAAASMADQSRASAMVPIMATIPNEMMEHLDKIKPLTFWSELSAEITPMKDKAIARLASSAEIPGEVLTGIGDANHWTAWLISDEGIRWIRGYLGLIADALTRGFLRRALESMGVTNPERYAFAFDTSTLASKPNRLDEAIQLHERNLIKDEEVVKAGAFSVDQMPTVQERAVQILLGLVKTQPDLILDPAIQAALGLPAVQSVGLPPTAAQRTDGDLDDDESEGAPNGGEAPDQPDADEARAITAALDRRIALAARPVLALPSPEAVFNASAKLMILRALELAGGRLTTPAERRGRWSDVPRHELHHHVGPITPDKARRVTEGAWNHVAVAAADLGVDAGELERVLSTYVLELLTRGLRHHDDMLYATLSMPNQGRGLLEVEAA
ncbi:portal protein [Actinoplanes phage phiAsp2]|uniref:Pas4 n=1 Tax=Actinoplanes phage phiAsp2 TaxID=279303 RepID=Q6J827_9CAUD|nr:portal protein [Actinoplanes phage phiAsp2]AAT36752.1 Pas4 [Actinoplanes phage phiAsp2]